MILQDCGAFSRVASNKATVDAVVVAIRTARRNRNQISRSVWSAWSLLPLSHAPRRSDSASKLDALQTLRDLGGVHEESPRLASIWADTGTMPDGVPVAVSVRSFWLFIVSFMFSILKFSLRGHAPLTGASRKSFRKKKESFRAVGRELREVLPLLVQRSLPSRAVL